MTAPNNTLVIQKDPDGMTPAIEICGIKFKARTQITVHDGRVSIDGVLKGVFTGSYGVVCRIGTMTEVGSK